MADCGSRLIVGAVAFPCPPPPPNPCTCSHTSRVQPSAHLDSTLVDLRILQSISGPCRSFDIPLHHQACCVVRVFHCTIDVAAAVAEKAAADLLSVLVCCWGPTTSAADQGRAQHLHFLQFGLQVLTALPHHRSTVCVRSSIDFSAPYDCNQACRLSIAAPVDSSNLHTLLQRQRRVSSRRSIYLSVSEAPSTVVPTRQTATDRVIRPTAC